MRDWDSPAVRFVRRVWRICEPFYAAFKWVWITSAAFDAYAALMFHRWGTVVADVAVIAVFWPRSDDDDDDGWWWDNDEPEPDDPEPDGLELEPERSADAV